MMTKTDARLLDEWFPLDQQATPAGAGGAVGAPVTPELLLRPDNRALFSRGIQKRRSAALVGYTGLNGSGKSFACVRDALPSLALGKRVLSTVTILDPESGNPHPNFELLRSWSQFHGLRDAEIILDEITGVMDARESGMPKHVKRMLHQQRRQNNRVGWTGISWDNADKRLRQITKAVVRARGHFPIHDPGELWPRNRMFVLTTFDAQTLSSAEDSDLITEDSGRKRRARVMNREFVWGPGSLAFRCYDTLAPVEPVDNSCPVCGGRVSEKVCRGHDPKR